MLTPSGPMGQTHWGDAASNNPNPSTHSADAQLKVNHLQFFLATHFFQAKILMRCFDTLFYLPGLYEQQELAAVFKKIGDKQTCTIGLYELYRITQLYPKVLSIGYIQRMFKIALFISCEKCS